MPQGVTKKVPVLYFQLVGSTQKTKLLIVDHLDKLQQTFHGIERQPRDFVI